MPIQEHYKLSEFNSLPNEPGIYAWYAFCRRQFPPEDYYKFFKAKKMKIYLKAPLLDRSFGFVESIRNDVVMDRSGQVDPTLLERLTMKFSPPIYIGIASNQTLRKRLLQHQKTLESLLNNNAISKSDKTFAERVNTIIKAEELDMNETSFIVRVLPLANSTGEEIRNLEYFVNRTFHPYLGMK